MNQQQPQAPEMEITNLTAAELRVWKEKYGILQAAEKDANAFLTFLTEQHEIGTDNGWRFSPENACFFRPKVQADAITPPAQKRSHKKKEPEVTTPEPLSPPPDGTSGHVGDDAGVV